MDRYESKWTEQTEVDQMDHKGPNLMEMDQSRPNRCRENEMDGSGPNIPK